MKELINVHALTAYLKKHAHDGTKLLKAAKIISLAWTLFTVIATVWSLIPKEDKLDEVDPDVLIKEATANTESQIAEGE